MVVSVCWSYKDDITWVKYKFLVIYNMLDLPLELYTPIFAIARIAGWSAHRIEDILNSGKIIRPAYKNVAKHSQYIPLSER